MKIFVINLKSDVKKRETMTNILNKYTSDYIFFEAINGKELKDDEYRIKTLPNDVQLVVDFKS